MLTHIRNATTFTILLSLVAISGIAHAGDIKSELQAANDTFGERFSAGDAAGIAALYTENGKLMPPGGEIVVGHEALEAFWNGAIGEGGVSLTLTTTEAEQFGDTAYDIGTGEFRDADGNLLSSAKYLVVWKKVDGEWKLHQDIFNANPPAE